MRTLVVKGIVLVWMFAASIPSGGAASAQAPLALGVAQEGQRLRFELKNQSPSTVRFRSNELPWSSGADRAIVAVDPRSLGRSLLAVSAVAAESRDVLELAPGESAEGEVDLGATARKRVVLWFFAGRDLNGRDLGTYGGVVEKPAAPSVGGDFEIRAVRIADECRVRFSIENESGRSASLGTMLLPWSPERQRFLIGVVLPGHELLQNVGGLFHSSPLPTTLPEGATVAGEVDLHQQLDTRRLGHSDRLVVLWYYEETTRERQKLGPAGGYVLFEEGQCVVEGNRKAPEP